MEIVKSKSILSMSTLMREKELNFFLRSGDTSEPPHVHVSKGNDYNNVAKFWLLKQTSSNPMKIQIAEKGRFSTKMLSRMKKDIEDNHLMLLEKIREEMINAGASEKEIEELDGQIRNLYPTFSPKQKKSKKDKKSRFQLNPDKISPELSDIYKLARKCLRHLDRCESSFADSEHDAIILSFEENDENLQTNVELYGKRKNGKYVIAVEVTDTTKDGIASEELFPVQEEWWIDERQIPEMLQKVNGILDSVYR